MTLTDVLTQDAESMYSVTEALFRQVDPKQLAWKPATGRNWMTTAQLLQHCTNACGSNIKGFMTGDWGLPEGMSFEDMPADAALPGAETMPAVPSVEAALAALAEDKAVAMRYLSEAGEADLLTRRFAPPWGGPKMTLFQHLHGMIAHLGQHKGQLFYYLKLQGKDVNTGHLWGM